MIVRRGQGQVLGHRQPVRQLDIGRGEVHARQGGVTPLQHVDAQHADLARRRLEQPEQPLGDDAALGVAPLSINIDEAGGPLERWDVDVASGDVREIGIPDDAAPLALLFFVLGLAGFAAVIAFRRAGTSPNPYRPSSQLVTTGIYRISRNPMYVGFTLWYLAAACWLNNVWLFVLLPIVLLVMLYGVILREERYLERQFGDEYRAYRKRVRRWL